MRVITLSIWRVSFQAKPRKPLGVLLKFLDRRARAEEIAIAIYVVDPRDSWPEFVFACRWRGESGLFARIGSVPFVGRDLSRSVRCVFEQIILPIFFSTGDSFDLRVNGNHRVTETIKLVFGFALGWLDHHCPCNRPGNGRRVKAIIHQTLGHIFDFYARVSPLAKIDDAFMRNETVSAFEQYRKITVEALGDIVRV